MMEENKNLNKRPDALHVEHVSFSYRDGPKILEEFSLQIPEGGLTMIIGPNGSGKTTLMKLCLGLLQPTGGEIFLEGKPVSQLSREQIARMAGYLVQDRTIPDLSCRRFVLHGRFCLKSWPRKFDQADFEAVKKALADFDASDLEERMMHEISGGQRQKVFLAASLVQNPDLLFLDEPASFLDIHAQRELLRNLKRLSANKTIIMVMHDLLMAMEFADSLVVMDQGKMLAHGDPQKILEQGWINKVFHLSLEKVMINNKTKYVIDDCEESERVC